jgi:hypothetical protein
VALRQRTLGHVELLDDRSLEPLNEQARSIRGYALLPSKTFWLLSSLRVTSVL